MVEIKIAENSCRGCRMCVDECPTDVFVHDEETRQARIREAADCIACLSCVYLCPSRAITAAGYHAVKNYYRDLTFSRRVEKFL